MSASFSCQEMSQEMGDMTESACTTRYFNTLYVGLPYLNPKNVLVESPVRNYISFVIQSKYGKFRPV